MITKENYIEWFLLYIDNELDTEQMHMVNAFVQSHLELQEEFDSLKETVLPNTSLEEQNWDNLIQNEQYWDEQSLLHLDKELDQKEEEKLFQHLSNNTIANKRYQELSQTILPEEEIKYPYKKELLRKENRKIIPLWIKISSIAAIVALGIFVFENQKDTHIADIPNSQSTVLTNKSISPKNHIDTNINRKENIVNDSTQKMYASNKKKNKEMTHLASSQQKKEEKIVHNVSPLDRISDDINWRKSENVELVKFDNPDEKDNLPSKLIAGNNIKMANFSEEKPANTEKKSTKRMIFAANYNESDEVYVANTSVNTKKIFKFFKQLKNESADSKKVQVANFEVNLSKTNNL